MTMPLRDSRAGEHPRGGRGPIAASEAPRVLPLIGMRRFLIPGIAVAVAVGLLALLTFGVADQKLTSSIDAKVARGTFPPAPDAHVALPVLGSSHLESLAAFRGKVVVMNVFASWCDPCREEAPILSREQHMLAGHGATIVGVTYLDNSSATAQFVKQEHITYPVLRDVSGNFVRSFGTTGVPETFIINRQGEIQALRRYQLVGSGWLDSTLSKILPEKS
jgi:cytochrome c biogenesis protein CcmG/thiol:disulfide interchange protein DsbE